MGSQNMGDPSWVQIPKALKWSTENREVSQFGRGQYREGGGLAW